MSKAGFVLTPSDGCLILVTTTHVATLTCDVPSTIRRGVPDGLCAQKPAPSNAERRRISELIAAFDAQGIQRTATAIDNTSADWLR